MGVDTDTRTLGAERRRAPTAENPPDASPALPIRLPELASWLGVENEAAAEMAESGMLPARVGSKGLEFDPVEVYRWAGGRPAAPLALSGETTREMARAFTSAGRIQDLYGVALSYAMELTRARSGWVFVVDAEAWLETLVVAGLDDSRRAAALRGVAAWVAINRRTVCVGLPLDEDTPPADAHWRFVVGLPVPAADGLHGVIVLDALRSGGVLDPDHLAGIEAVATHLAVAVDLRLARRQLEEAARGNASGAPQGEGR